ncbi:hypothetical protein C1646_672049 [Rhizophagus diaphanus]|nr:hypothetical protein C1646_672049 [Rhizophagus diaphanus] [Rhizophagus sp. MUCL 43196]
MASYHIEEKEVRLTKLITMIMMKFLIIKHQIGCFINLNEVDIKQLEIKEEIDEAITQHSLLIILIYHVFKSHYFTWSESFEKIISKKFSELVLMEYIWSFLEREWGNAADKSILDSQTKFDEASNKVVKALKNAGDFLNKLAGNEPIALTHTLWFGILDLAQNLIQRSSRIATYGLCYYLAIESLNTLRKKNVRNLSPKLFGNCPVYP